MKKKILVILFAVLAVSSRAQQDEMYTQFFSNTMVLNPAYAGSHEAISAMAIYRNQWVGFEGSPKTLAFTAHTPLFRNTSGIGIGITNDKIGIFRNMILEASYAFRIQFPWGKVSMGFSGRVKQIQMDWNDTNPLLLDTSIPYADNNTFLPNVGAGLYFYNDFMYLGASAPHIIENDLNLQAENNTIVSEASIKRHYIAMAGGIYKINNTFKLKPGILVKYVANTPLQIDYNLSLIISDKVLVGLALRSKDAFSAMAQLYLSNQMSIGYAYDFSFSELAQYQKGSHEVFIAIDLPFSGYGVDNPRFF